MATGMEDVFGKVMGVKAVLENVPQKGVGFRGTVFRHFSDLQTSILRWREDQPFWGNTFNFIHT